MKTILLLGVGRSTHTLLKYLIDNKQSLNIKVVIADSNISDHIRLYSDQKLCDFIHFNVNNQSLRQECILNADIVISMLPPKFHFLIAKDCIKFKKDLITASYVSHEIADLDLEAKREGVLILNEIGLDPGIDHISAMAVIDELKNNGYTIDAFKSFCGGLIAPESDTNPWNYKFTWNPKNVVLAGSSGATYLKNNKIKRFQYKEVFSHIENVNIPNYGLFESYANRDSLHYQNKYGLNDATTIVRGTLRAKGFSKAWDVFVKLGFTSNLIGEKIIAKKQFCEYLSKLKDEDIKTKMDYLDLYNDKYNIDYKSPSDYLLNVLKDKWTLCDTDIDMIVMQHQFDYHLGNKSNTQKISMVVKGDNNLQTAMAKTVGLPVYFACKLLLQDKISLKGVRIPIYNEIYNPILDSLSKEGINFIKN